MALFWESWVIFAVSPPALPVCPATKIAFAFLAEELMRPICLFAAEVLSAVPFRK